MAKNYVQKNFNTKLGEKKLAQTVKETTKLCLGNSIEYYSKFLSISKNIRLEKTNNIILLSNNFNQLFRPLPEKKNTNNFNIIFESIEDIDRQLTIILVSNSILHSDNM